MSAQLLSNWEDSFGSRGTAHGEQIKTEWELRGCSHSHWRCHEERLFPSPRLVWMSWKFWGALFRFSFLTIIPSMNLPDLRFTNDLLSHWLMSIRHHIFIHHLFIGQFLTVHLLCARTVLGTGNCRSRPDVAPTLIELTFKWQCISCICQNLVAVASVHFFGES